MPLIDAERFAALPKRVPRLLRKVTCSGKDYPVQLLLRIQPRIVQIRCELLWRDDLLPLALDEPEPAGPLDYRLELADWVLAAVATGRFFVAARVEAAIAAGPASRLQLVPGAKVVNQLPGQVLEPLRFEILKMQRADRSSNWHGVPLVNQVWQCLRFARLPHQAPATCGGSVQEPEATLRCIV